MESTTCHELLSSLSEYVDGELSDDLCALIEQHMSGCQDCQIVVDTLRKTISLYHTSAQQVEVPEDVRDRLFHCLELDEFIKPLP
jgi:anti-sigma factor (TIGR02949 family)